MDSMRSLNTSLPHSSRRRAKNAQASGELLSAFKAAALSVTQLYKTAASDEDAARAEGYQEALDELLNFLDQENLGLGDGEGWMVRQWATERLAPASYGSEVDEEMDEDKPTSRASQRHTQTDSSTTTTASNNSTNTSAASNNTKHSSRTTTAVRDRNSPDTISSNAVTPESTTTLPASSPAKTHSRPPAVRSQSPEHIQNRPVVALPSTPEVFHFRSPVQLPPPSQGIDSDMQVDGNHPMVRLPPRTLRQHSSQNRSQLREKSLGNIMAAGMKRKTSLNDFFDFGNLGREDRTGPGSGGGITKKTRFE